MRNSYLPLALSTLVGGLPAMAQGKVLVTCAKGSLCSGSSVRFTETQEGAPQARFRWASAPVQAIQEDGIFAAPVVEQVTLFTVTATSLADGKSQGELPILVWPGDPASVALHLAMPLFEAELNGPALSGRPFLTFETPGARFFPDAQVTASGLPAAIGKQVAGYGMAVPLRLDAKHADADGVLLTYREGADLQRVDGTGRLSTQVTLTGRVRDCNLEVLRQVDAKAGTWTSHLDAPGLQVRGLVPLAGNPVALDGEAEADGKGTGARFRSPYRLACLGDLGKGTAGEPVDLKVTPPRPGRMDVRISMLADDGHTRHTALPVLAEL